MPDALPSDHGDTLFRFNEKAVEHADALNLIYLAHARQEYAPGVPYTEHLAEVASICRPYGHNAIIVGLLHDIVEDTPITIRDVEAKTRLFIAECVAILTDEVGNRKQRKARQNEKLAAVEPKHHVALVVKAADRLANVRACVKNGDSRLSMYRREHADFRAACYRDGLCDSIWNQLDSFINADA